MATAAAVALPSQPPEVAVNKWFIAVSVALGALLEVVDTSIVNVALTDMQASLGATLSEVGWVITSYGIANVIILPLSAWLGDRFGKKSFFVFSLIAFTAASILCGLATTLPMLVVARVLQGLFGGGLMAKAQSILFETFPREEQAKAQGLFGAVVIAGPAIGPTLGGWLVTNMGWRWIFFINLPLGIIGVMMCLSALPPDGVKKGVGIAVDWLAIGLLSVGLGCLQGLLEEGESHEWFNSTGIQSLTVVALVTLVWFVVRELNTEHPVVDLRVLRYRSLWAGSILSMVVGMGLYGTLFAVPIFAQNILHFTSQQTGMLLLPGAIASAFMMPIAARLLRSVDARLLLATGAGVLILSILQLNKLTPQSGADDLFWPLITRAFGTVCMFLPLSMLSLADVPKKEIAAATGLYNLTRQLGGSIGIAILTALLTSRQAFHRAVLVEKLASDDAAVLDRVRMYTALFVSKGNDALVAGKRALALLTGAVDGQAAVMSFSDTFTVTAFVILGSLPLLFLFKKVEAGKGGASAGH